ncbi:MAG: ABC transporter substrate-binding protein [Polyangiaceae bacterium]|nr:ABC transporter substrate-binding protein [Polyangiaceae bacterium]
MNRRTSFLPNPFRRLTLPPRNIPAVSQKVTAVEPLRLAAMAALISLGSGCSGTNTEEEKKDPIYIATNFPLSGTYSNYGTTWRDAVELATAQVNAAGGIDGRTVVLDHHDSQGDPTTAADQTAAIGESEVYAMIGPGFTGELNQSLPAVTNAELFTISGSSTGFVPLERGELVVRTVAPASWQAAVLARNVADVSLPAVVVYTNNPHSLGQKNNYVAMRSGANLSVLAEVELNPNGAGAQAAWQQVQSHLPADGSTIQVALFAMTDEAEGLFNEWQIAGAPPVAWRFGEALRDENLFVRRPELAGSIGVAPTHAADGPYQTFASNYESKFGVVPTDVFASMFYDALLLTALGLAKSPTNLPTGNALWQNVHSAANGPGSEISAADLPAALAAAVSGEDVNFQGVSGNLTLDDLGDSLGPVEIWQVDVDGKISTLSISTAETL